MRADSEEIVVEKRYLSTVPQQSAEVDRSACVRTAASMADFWSGVQIVVQFTYELDSAAVFWTQLAFMPFEQH